MRIGIFGGSFDPPHRGHFEIAKAALRDANLDKIYFIPAKQNPHKTNLPQANDSQRIEMINSLIEAESKFEMLDIELNRPSPSYSIDTLRFIKNKNSSDSLFLIIGSDTLNDLDKWKESKEIINIVSGVIVYPRDKSQVSCPSFLDTSKFILLSGDLFEESSSMLRDLLEIQKAEGLENFLPSKVLKIIQNYRLYGIKN